MKILEKLILTSVLILVTNAALAQQCYTSSILSPNPFMGNDGEIFKLSDGSLWEVRYEYEYLYAYYPTVVICPSIGRLLVDGRNLNVEQVGKTNTNSPSRNSRAEPVDVIESRIDGDFEGWDGETIVKLMNGQIWQQIEYYYHYHYSFMPDVLIYRSGGGYKMKVDGIRKSVGVIQLR